ncbi:MAG: ABC transporter permease [Mycoplasma sp.]|nr:ABC transporter permease [Mycoplasma sp.]
MNKFKNAIKYSYILIILILCYIPLFTMAIFSFNKTSDKGYVSFVWNGFSWDAYKNLFSSQIMLSLLNSIIVAIITSLFVVTISLITVFSLWRQKNKVFMSIHSLTNNISMINPDIIIGVSLAIFFASVFGSLSSGNEGLMRTVLGHTVMTLPYGILIMYPKSEKFNRSLFEASWDLGYSKIKTWFRTYFIYMFSSIIFTIIITCIFSFDDFIITSITSNTTTIGTQLYQGQFRSWALALGTLILFLMVITNVVFFIRIQHKSKSVKLWKK